MRKVLGLLIASFNTRGCAADEFNDWYDTEHVPDRERVPGFLTLERWTGAEDPNVTLAIYDLQSIDVLQSPQYLAIGQNNPSPWTRRLLPKCERILRFVGEQIAPGNVIAPQGAGGLLFMGFNIAPGMENEYASRRSRQGQRKRPR